MSGPTIVAGSAGSPVESCPTLATNFSLNSAATLDWTRHGRFADMQIWPWWVNRLKTAASTA